MTPEIPNALRTPAWLLSGIFNKPGVLELASGLLGFTTENGRVFEAPLSQVTNVKFPWYYFSGGVKFQIGQRKYRLSFVRPNGAESVAGRLWARSGGASGAAAGLLTAGAAVRDIGIGRKAGKAWRAVLSA